MDPDQTAPDLGLHCQKTSEAFQKMTFCNWCLRVKTDAVRMRL